MNHTEQKIKEIKTEKEKIKDNKKTEEPAQVEKIVTCKECGKEFSVSIDSKKRNICPMCKQEKDEKRKGILKNVGKGACAIAGLALMYYAKGKIGEKDS